ncbi:MAG: ATP synthase F1 subunit delta [Planctomycetia bacterium]|nr:ATP synthase F1 subunit delta [Planctomycetia bacterium]
MTTAQHDHHDNQQPAGPTGAGPTNIGVERLSKVYAQAIIEAADRKQCRREVIAELGAMVRDVLPKVPKAGLVFDSPKVTPEEKSAVINRICAGHVLPTTLHALHVLARHGRLGMLSHVVAAAERLADELEGRRQATFTTAVPLDAAEQSQIVASIEQSIGANVSPTFIVNPELIGGLIVRIADTVYDHSVATSLVRLRARLKQRSIHEIQYGRDRLGTA